MQLLYGIFYTVISLGIMMAFTVPLVWFLRFMEGNHEKKFVIWQWRILFFRSICPIALSSLLCMFPKVNRQYHIWLSCLGLKIKDGKGVMHSWKDVFTSEISVTKNFQICSILWVAGMAVVLLYFGLAHRRLCHALNKATEIGEGIYESKLVLSPLMLGFFKKKIVVPEGFQTKDLAWLLCHMEQRKTEQLQRLLMILCVSIHWFNPIMWIYIHIWSNDVEINADERVWKEKALKQKALRVIALDESNPSRKNRIGMLRNHSINNVYAQSILNFLQETPTLKRQKLTCYLTVSENNISNRAKRMMYKEKDSTGRQIGHFLLTVFLGVVLFMMVSFRMAWLGSMEEQEKATKSEQPLFEKKEAVVVSKVSTTSLQGLEYIVQLEMEDGEHRGDAGYDGSFVLKLYDNLQNELDERDMDEIFTTQKKESYHFSSGMPMMAKDYNGNGKMEIVLGQEKVFTQEEFGELIHEDEENDSEVVVRTKEDPSVADYEIFSYAILEIQEEGFVKVGDNIITAGKKGSLRETRVFDTLEGISDVITTQIDEKVIYYEWNEDSSCYEKRRFTQEELEAKRQVESDGTEGGIKEHTLEDSEGKVAVLVSTRIDDTGSQEITSVTLYPRQEQEKFEDIKGYFCDLMWTPELGQKEKRFVTLIYNGTSSQTFVIYDVKERTVYHQQEDGAKELETIFAEHGDHDITFQEKGAVLYDIVQKRGDTLEITFVAEADGGITVKGNYEYNRKEKKYANLTFTRVVKEAGEGEKEVPTPEPLETGTSAKPTVQPSPTPTFEEEVNRLFNQNDGIRTD